VFRHRGSPRHKWLGHQFQGQKVKGQLVADVLNSQHAGIGAIWQINTKILSTCRGGGISWRPPAYSLLCSDKEINQQNMIQHGSAIKLLQCHLKYRYYPKKTCVIEVSLLVRDDCVKCQHILIWCDKTTNNVILGIVISPTRDTAILYHHITTTLLLHLFCFIMPPPPRWGH